MPDFNGYFMTKFPNVFTDTPALDSFITSLEDSNPAYVTSFRYVTTLLFFYVINAPFILIDPCLFNR